jgi:hypothetical protein
VKTDRAACLAALRSERHEIKPNQKFQVDDFQPEDAQGVARLYYAVYGNTFPIDYVYDPAELVRLNTGLDLHQVVGRTENGDIVGLYALFRNPPGRHIMEGGSWIVHPVYRNTSLAARMARKIHKHPPDKLELDVIFGQCVCNHVITQKLGVSFDSLVCALELEPMPPKPDELGGNQEGRVSLLDEFIILNDRPHAVFLPRQYAGILRSMYAARELVREFAEDSLPADGTVFSVFSLSEARFAKMTVEEIGRDFAARLADMESNHVGFHVYQVVLPLNKPGCSLAVEAARKAGFFMGGFLPLWFDRDGLLLQKVAGEPDLRRIQLYRQESKDLLQAIMEDRRSVQATPLT